MTLIYIAPLWIHSFDFCVACEARMTHRDHDSGGDDVGLSGLIPDLCTLTYFDRGVIRNILTELWPFFT